MRRIVVASKPGVAEPWVVTPAVQLAGESGAEVDVLVVDDVESQRFESIPRAETHERARVAAEALAAELLARGVPARAVTRSGPAVATAIGYADEVDADLIVVGTSRGGVIGRLLGSFAIDLVQRAGRQVLVVTEPGA